MSTLKINNNFNREMNALADKLVKVELDDADRYYIGKLVGFDLTTSAIVLTNATDELKMKYSKIIIHGNMWSKIFQEEPPFPMEELGERIAKMFPAGQIKYQQESNTISILNGKIIVSENGVEGSGPTAERVNRIFEQFLEEIK
ncbi:MAG: Lsm family RNA-binding protein [Candidatus Lokiarchaeota archaeon]|nr:Lsm family RNA-binding protein [Candidatus Lokiarchaeota archaeon]